MIGTEFEQDPVGWLKNLSESMRKITLEAIGNLTKRQSEQQTNVVPPPSTVKRRGRPPKVVSNNAPEDKENSPIKEKRGFKIPEQIDSNKNIVEIPPSTAKSRGRPPKINNSKIELESKETTPIRGKRTGAIGFKVPETAKKTQPEDPVKREEILVPPPSTIKRRGRPRKYAVTQGSRESEELNLASSQPAAAVNILPKPVVAQPTPPTVVIPPSTIKRKKGRPSLASKKARLSDNITPIREHSLLKTPVSGFAKGFKPILPVPTQSANSVETWVTVSKETQVIAPSVLATPKLPINNSLIPNAMKEKAPSPVMQKVESWTSKFMKPIVPPPPPSTIKRSARIAAKYRAQTQAESLTVDSPLTRAKRIDLEFSKREAEIKSLIETGSDILKKKIDSLSLESTSLKVQKPFNKDLNEVPPTQPIIQSNVDAVSVGEIMHETPLNIDLGGDEDELFSRKIEEKFAADTLSKLTDLASSSQQSAESTFASGISAKLDENSLNRIRERQENGSRKEKATN